MFNIKVKHVLDEIGAGDGTRIMVDRKLPSGYDEWKLRIDMWAREALPSDGTLNNLCETQDWGGFEEAYFKELDIDKDYAIDAVVKKAILGPVTLLHNSKDRDRNLAVAMREYLISRERKLVGEQAA